METRAFTCPYCDTSQDISADEWYHTCDTCRQRVDLTAHYAYLRGRDAFQEGQKILEGVPPRRRRNPLNLHDRQAMDLFREAYSALQVAFLSQVAPGHRAMGIEMMALMSEEFLKRDLVSPLEMTYWKSLMIERVAQEEYDLLRGSDVQPGGIFGVFRQTHSRSRKKKLLKSLLDLDKTIRACEKQIDFIDAPKTRNTRWKPEQS